MLSEIDFSVWENEYLFLGPTAVILSKGTEEVA